ncbi:hypothetical protein ABK040_014156 [Willaertia magna]
MKRKEEKGSSNKKNEEETKKRKIIVISDDEEEEDILTLNKVTNNTINKSKTTNSTINTTTISTCSFNGEHIYYNKLENELDSNHFLTLTQILEPSKAKSIFLSSFCLDFEFLQTIIPFKTKCIPITISKHWSKTEEKQGRTILQIGKSPFCICHPPLLNQYSNMHAKLFLIEFEGYLRVVVTSANLTNFDWENFKQTIWIQDFPLKGNNNNNTKFGKLFENSLFEFWGHLTCNLPHKFLMRYDFSNANAVLIASVPGYHKDIKKYGHGAIKEALKQLEFDKLTNLKSFPVYYQMSSLGTMNTDWIKELLTSFYTKTINNGDLFHIIFPTLQCVNNSHFGLRAGGMIHFRSKSYQTKTFPKQCMSLYEPTQSNHLSHSKIALHVGLDKEENSIYGWICTGSHNLSQAALGKLQKNDTQIFISNYELSICMKVKSNIKIEKDVIDNSVLESACGLIIPFTIPPTRYDFKSDEPFILENVQDN